MPKLSAVRKVPETITLQAVSYTHLDVYKRQDSGRPFEEKERNALRQ